VIAFRNGTGAPIPFQVDERRGRKLALEGGAEPTRDDRPEVLDAEDVVVFMACDLGDAASPPALETFQRAGAAPVTWREVRVEEPLTGAVGHAYLAVSDAPPASEHRYVGYQPAGDLVSAAAYRIGLVRTLPTYFALGVTGAFGPNLLDGLRLRADATLRADLAHWRLNEQQGSHTLIAWKAGPVRVVRRSRHQVNLPLGIRLTAGLAHTYFYPRHVFGPGSLKLPFSPSLLFRDITAFGGADARDLHGWRYHAPGTPPKGFRIDGQMDAAERAYDATGDWFVLAHPGEALLFVTRMSPNLAERIRLGLVYRDDAAHAEPPETSPGAVPLAGYAGREVERLPAGRYTFQLRVLVLDGYRPGDERRLLAQIDTPLVIATRDFVSDRGTEAEPAAR
jgi:hypothetical protein